jgi:hypothetical protein
MWDLWWTQWRWARFSLSISVSPASLHSTNCSTVTIIYHLGLVQQASSVHSTKWTQSHPTHDDDDDDDDDNLLHTYTAGYYTSQTTI